MEGLRLIGTLTLIFSVLFEIIYSSPINITPQSVPVPLIQSAINFLNDNSPTQHTYRGGNLISAQKLIEPDLVIYRLTLNLDTVCEGLSNCPREACAIDLKVRSEDIEINRNSIQCMYLYPQQEDHAQHLQQAESAVQEISQVENSGLRNSEDDKSSSQNTLQLDHEVEATEDSQRPGAESPDNKPFIAVRAQSSNYCPGCPYELNPNLPGLAAFGTQALDVMDRLGHNDFKHKLIRILKVTRAVPLGSNVVQYKLLAEIGETNCLKTTLIERSQCSLQGNIPVRVCLVTFEEHPWQQSDRQVVGNNCTVPSDLENEINASLNPVLNGNSHLVGNGQPERVDSVQEVIGKTAHIDQLAQEGKIGTYNSLIDPIVENSAANVTPENNITAAPFFEEVLPTENSQPSVSVRRHVAEETNEERQAVTEVPFVKVELERDDTRQPAHGFVDKQREFDEFLSDFDIPVREPVERVTEDTRQPVTEEIIRPEKVGEGNDHASSEEDGSVESAESTEDRNPSRAKRALSRTQRSEKTLVKALARKAVDTLDDIDKDDNKRVVRHILESKREEVTDGFLYRLTIEVALTDCQEADDSESEKDCLEKSIGPMKICKVQIHTDDKDPLLSAKVFQSECSKEPTKGKNTRNKRTPKRLAGAPAAISIDTEEVQNYVNLGFQKFSATFKGPNEPILVKITNATRQTVAGSLFKINVTVGMSDCPKGTKENCNLMAESERKECLITAWSRPWLAGEDALKIEVECNTNAGVEPSVGEGSSRSRRALGGVGVPSAISIDDDEIREYANRGLEKLSATHGGSNELMFVEIKNATTQVVAGTKYTINAVVGTSDCPKGKKENCNLLAGSEQKECKITAWSRPWLTGEEALKIEVDCKVNGRAARSVGMKITRNRRALGGPGAPSAISIDNEEIVNYAHRGLEKFSATYGETNEPILHEILSATKQIVEGTLYKIRARFGKSDCPKGKKENCNLLADSEKKECEIEAWSRPWLAGEDALKITLNCDPKIRSKRGLKGKNYSQKMLEQGAYMRNERLFNDFIVKYNKTYSSSLERKNRLKIFHQNMMMVQELQRNEQGTAIYGASMFADLTTEEFKKKYLGLKPELRLDNEIPIPMAEIPEIEIPIEYDWRNYNVVTPVKNQGQCGSCWAFSVTGNVEGQYAIRHSNLLSFSEQELVDCDTLDEGCNGGLPDNAYRAIEKLGGLELESDYPYDGENEACHFNKTEAKVKVVSAVNITSNETQMAQWLVQNGPISIGINANAMQFYMGGVSHPFKFLCSPSNLDHGVLIVGYGIHTYPIFHKTLPYWTIKNSWGPSWGEQGYYRVYRGDGTCGVNQMASSAVVA